MSIGRIVRGSACLLAGLLLGGSMASAKGLSRKAKAPAALVEVEGKLLEYEEEHAWCTYKPGAVVHGVGESPWARFRVSGPTIQAGRSFGVLLKCGTRKDLLPALRSGLGRNFTLVVPQDFLEGKYSEIEDCSISPVAMRRWMLVEGDSKAR